MKKSILKSFTVMFVCSILCATTVITVFAASISIGASTGSVSPGGTFTVSIGGNVTGRVNVSVSNGTANASSVWVENSTASVTITAGSSGSVTVTASPIAGLSDENGDLADASPRSVSVSIIQPAAPSTPNTPTPPSNNQPVTPQAPKEEDKRSTDNTLSSLTVSGGELSPAFSAGETSYSVALSAETTKVTIDAKATDGKATVSGTGEKDVKAGKNEFTVTVTAENGSTKEYKIAANVDEKPLVFTEYGQTKLGVVRNTSEVKVPSGFAETTVKVDGSDVTAWKNEKLDKTIVYMVDEKDNKSFYLYEDGKVTTSFTYRTMVGREFYIVDIPADKQKITGMTYQQLTIDETPLMGWVFDDPALENYQVIYVMDMDGNMQYYQYEITQNTLQLYSHAAAMTQETYEKEHKNAESTKMLLIATSVVMTLVAIGGIGFAIYTKKKKS